MKHNYEITELSAYLATKSKLYDFDTQYHDAKRLLVLIRNPKMNYDVQRRTAVYRYLKMRGSPCTPVYMSWVRQDALSALAAVKVEFSDVVGRAA